MSEKAVEIRGEMLKEARRICGLNQEELSHLVDCSVRTVASAESGKVSAPLAKKLAEAVGINYELLLTSEAGPQVLFSGLMPQRPAQVIGREADFACLLKRFNYDLTSETKAIQAISAVRGWPGVGKTTLASELAYRPETKQLFPEGVLWASLGQNPDVRGGLAQWARALGDNATAILDNATEMSRRLAARLCGSRILLIVDDVWEARDAQLYLVGGPSCGMLLTTRLLRVAEELTPSSAHQYHLDILSESESLELLGKLSPQSLLDEPDGCRALVCELEGLPLAIQVAGRLLRTESRLGSGAAKVQSLLSDIREGAKRILQQPAPVLMHDAIDGSIPTVTALLRLSTDVLGKSLRYQFAAISFYPPKPATFDVSGLAEVWGTTEGEAVAAVKELVDRGLLEVAGKDRVQCHALLLAHAANLAEELS